ncbi:MAG: hypothetical protein M3P30_15920 [Chloroflexota bacterium]|nr:hypothetical protein [Chloroflexota bacterium]
MRLGVATWLSIVLLLVACGADNSVRYKATPADPTASAVNTATGAITSAVAGTVIVPGPTVITGERTLPPATSVATATAALPTATSTPGPPGQTGIAGLVTIGPTCPVQRIDSPCPDRPYEAAITVWQGGAKVAEARSAAGGRYLVELPPGSYRVVGESPGTLPRGTEQEAVVEAGRITTVDLRYDSGIR